MSNCIFAKRIAKFPAESITDCKQMVYESIDKPIAEALKAEAYWLYQATSKTPVLKRFQLADDQGLQHVRFGDFCVLYAEVKTLKEGCSFSFDNDTKEMLFNQTLYQYLRSSRHAFDPNKLLDRVCGSRRRWKAPVHRVS